MLNELIKYAKHVNANDDVVCWINTHVKSHITKEPVSQIELEHIIDYMASDKRPKKISRMSYVQAKANAEKWNNALIKKGSAIEEKPEDISVVKEFGDGFRIVRLVGENAYKREGFLMRHCVAGYYGKKTEIYSLRDKDNMPHCTMEKDQQIKGKGNGSIHPKYIKYIVSFIEEVGMKVGDNEMSNLGYINIEKIKDKLDIIKSGVFNNKYFYQSDTLYAVDGTEYCELDVWDYKPLIVELDLNVKINFTLSEFIPSAINKILSLIKPEQDNKGNYAKIGGSGDYAKIGSSGDFAQIVSSGHYAKIGSSGYSAKIGSSGHYAQIGSSGNSSQIGSSGHYAKIGNSGNSAQIGSSGDYAHIGSSGHYVQIGSSGHYAKIGSSGDSTQIGSSGDYVQIGSSGDHTQIGSSGDYAQIGSSGHYAKIGSSGYSAKIGISGDYAQIGSSGNCTKISITGYSSIATSCGTDSKGRVGKKGCLVLTRWVAEEKRYRVSVGYEGENLIEGVWYKIDSEGNFVETNA